MTVNVIDEAGKISVSYSQKPEVNESVTHSEFKVCQIPLCNTERVLAEQSPVTLKSTVKTAETAMAEAEKQGVAIKKRAFIKNLALAVGSGVVSGICLVMTISTAGATTPLLLLAASHFTVAVGDSVCSYMDYKGKRPDLLPMGQDSIGNVAFKALESLGYEAPKAFRWADKISLVTRSLIAPATLSSHEQVRVKMPTSFKYHVRKLDSDQRESIIRKNDRKDFYEPKVRLSDVQYLENQDNEKQTITTSGHVFEEYKLSASAQQQLSKIEHVNALALTKKQDAEQNIIDRRDQWLRFHRGDKRFTSRAKLLSSPEAIKHVKEIKLLKQEIMDRKSQRATHVEIKRQQHRNATVQYKRDAERETASIEIPSEDDVAHLLEMDTARYDSQTNKIIDQLAKAQEQEQYRLLNEHLTYQSFSAFE